jgi:hypothetical protein
MEQPWGEVGTQPGGNSCGTCEYDRSANTFTGRFVNSWMTGAKDGLIDVDSQTYSLWAGSLGAMSITKTLSPAPTSETKATLWYYKVTSIGNIWYYEGVTIVP